MRRKRSTPSAPLSRTCVPDSVQRALDAAAHRALEAFPVKVGTVDRVAVSENVTYRVTDCAGRGPFVLRLHRPAYNTLRQLEAERAWTGALNKAGIRAPAGVQTRTGDHFTAVSIAPGEEVRFAGLTRWIEGEVLSTRLEADEDTESAYRTFLQIGRLAASMHRQALAWTPPSGFDRPHLDNAGLLGETPRWGRFWDHPDLGETERRHLLTLRAQAMSHLEEYGTSTRTFGLIHADLHADNILVHGNTVAVIDFDDSAYGWLIYDLATALVDILERPDYDRLRQALIAGYETLRPLPNRDLAILDTLVTVRAMSLIGWFGERPEHEDSAYLTALRAWLQRARLSEA